MRKGQLQCCNEPTCQVPSSQTIQRLASCGIGPSSVVGLKPNNDVFLRALVTLWDDATFKGSSERETAHCAVPSMFRVNSNRTPTMLPAADLQLALKSGRAAGNRALNFRARPALACLPLGKRRYSAAARACRIFIAGRRKRHVTCHTFGEGFSKTTAPRHPAGGNNKLRGGHRSLLWFVAAREDGLYFLAVKRTRSAAVPTPKHTCSSAPAQHCIHA